MKLSDHPERLAARILDDLELVTGLGREVIKTSRTREATAARRAWCWLIAKLGELAPADVEALLDRATARADVLHAGHKGTRSREIIDAVLRGVSPTKSAANAAAYLLVLSSIEDIGPAARSWG